jgi:hypothetical protein
MLLKLLLSDRSKTPMAMITVCMGRVAIALLSLKFLQPSARLGPGSVDFLHGVLFGAAIGVILLAVILTAGQRRASRVLGLLLCFGASVFAKCLGSDRQPLDQAPSTTVR